MPRHTAEKQPGRLWVRQIRGHRAVKDLTLPCAAADPRPALREAAREMDLEMPVWLPRHEADWKQFMLTRFTQDHFMEHIDFDRLEISYIAPESERKPPRFTEE
jgi:hypothetical protein